MKSSTPSSLVSPSAEFPCSGLTGGETRDFFVKNELPKINIRKTTSNQGEHPMLELGLIWDDAENDPLTVRPISYESTKPFILNIHYARRMPSISHSFGLYEGSQLIGVVTYGMPSSNNLCEGICGKENRKNVIELNRLCLSHNRPNEASMLVGRSLQMLPKPMIVVSYADSGQKHIGIVYQATNFLFTGTTKLRTDPLGESNKHARHTACAGAQRTTRFPKHRYVFFVGSKTERKRLRKQLLYPVIPYIKNEIN